MVYHTKGEVNMCPRDGWNPEEHDKDFNPEVQWPAMVSCNIFSRKKGTHTSHTMTTKWLCPVCFTEFSVKEKIVL